MTTEPATPEPFYTDFQPRSPNDSVFVSDSPFPNRGFRSTDRASPILEHFTFPSVSEMPLFGDSDETIIHPEWPDSYETPSATRSEFSALYHGPILLD